MRPAVALLLVAAATACSPVSIASLTRGGDPSLAKLVENRAWIERDAPVPGTARAWMSTGQLLTTSCFELPRLSKWRWTSAVDLEWSEEGERIRAEVAAAGPDELILLIGTGDAPRVMRLRAAEPDALC